MAIRELETNLQRMKDEMDKVANISGILDGTAESLQTAATTLTQVSQHVGVVADSMPRLDLNVSAMASSCRNLDSTLQGVRQDLQSVQRTIDEINRGTNGLLKAAEKHDSQLVVNRVLIIVVGGLSLVTLIIMCIR